MAASCATQWAADQTDLYGPFRAPYVRRRGITVAAVEAWVVPVVIAVVGIIEVAITSPLASAHQSVPQSLHAHRPSRRSYRRCHP